MRGTQRAVLATLALLAPIVVTNPAGAAMGTTTRVSVASDGTQGSGASIRSVISADGRYVAFSSFASNLVAGDTNGQQDVFVRDGVTGATTRVSVASDGTQGSPNPSSGPSISADGRHVAFYSGNALVTDDTNGMEDVFVHDRDTGTTTRVSVASDGSQGNGHSRSPSISADGRYVSFHSFAVNLVDDDSNSSSDVFVHDRDTGITTRVSVASDGTQGTSHSSQSTVSADGTLVAFQSRSTNLVSGDTNSRFDVFVHDRDTGATSRVSVASDGTQGSGDSLSPAISADATSVAFSSFADDLVADDTNGVRDVFVHDRGTGATTRVSVATDGTQGNITSQDPAISADGNAIAFVATADNLVADDTNGAVDVFVRDRTTGQTTRVSVASDSTQGNGHSLVPSMSADGNSISFTSFANNLVVGDTNNGRDIFVHDRPEAPSDPAPADPVLARAHKITQPAGHENGWVMCLAGPGTEGLNPGTDRAGKECVTTATVDGVAGVAAFSAVLSPGSYEITEEGVDGWEQVGSDGCGFNVVEPLEPGHVFDCFVTNVQYGTVSVDKTSSGQVPAAGAFSFELRIGASPSALGEVLGSDTNDALGNVDFAEQLPFGVSPGNKQLCETRLLPGWHSSLADLPGGFVPDSDGPDPDNSIICVAFRLEPGELEPFVVENTPPPGGDARGSGFWRNWSSCSGGNQDPVLDDTLAAAGGVLVGDLLVDTCEEAVAILGKSDLSGLNRASDPAYNLAAQLLAALLSVEAQAGVCPTADAAMNDAKALLAGADFDGHKSYGGSSTKGKKKGIAATGQIDMTVANDLARVLNAYSDNQLC